MNHQIKLQQKLNKLEQLILDKIRANGPMDFAEFMDLALCHHQYGYYVTRDPLGQAGDFITAPEISQMFGEIIGAWVVDVWHKMGSPELFYLMEVGPGRGTLMADMLRVAAKVERFKNSVHVLLHEASPVLREKQKQKLAAQCSVSWVDGAKAVPEDAPIIIIGNEFLDTVPIHQVFLKSQGWMERVVIEDQNGALAFDLRSIPETLFAYVPRYPKADELYEISPIQVQHMSDWCKLVLRHGGAILQIDYGHAMTVSGEFLHAIRGHKHISILDDVGTADITCNVDFEPLMRMALSLGLNGMPVVRQGDFLKSLGIEQRAKKLKEKDEEGTESALRRLVDGDKMGNLFKVFCCYHNLNAPPEGFI